MAQIARTMRMLNSSPGPHDTLLLQDHRYSHSEFARPVLEAGSDP